MPRTHPRRSHRIFHPFRRSRHNSRKLHHRSVRMAEIREYTRDSHTRRCLDENKVKHVGQGGSQLGTVLTVVYIKAILNLWRSGNGNGYTLTSDHIRAESSKRFTRFTRSLSTVKEQEEQKEGKAGKVSYRSACRAVRFANSLQSPVFIPLFIPSPCHVSDARTARTART